MKILLTGATGFIGKRLGKELVQHGHEIVAISRKPEQACLVLPFPVVVFENAADALHVGIDAIVNLAGEPVISTRWTERKKKAILESRADRTRELLKAANQASKKPSIFVSASAIGFYGDRGNEVLTEESSPGTDFLAHVCEEWENAARDENVMRKVSLRIGIVLGREGGALSEMIPLYKTGMGGPLGDGKQWMSWIHVDDLISLFRNAIEDSRWNGVYNAVSPHPVSNADFSHALARSLGRYDFLSAPRFAIRAALGEMASAVLASQRVIPVRTKAMEFDYRFSDLKGALDEICEPFQDSQNEFFSEQWIPKKVEEIFPFFSDASNLETLTPPWLNFKILQVSTPELQEGTLIDYRLKIHGLPVGWRTRIESWEKNHQFVDVQLKGPYSRWHHTHRFEPLAGGTLIQDRVLYRLPAGRLGSLIMGRKVRSDVSEIFSYRRQKLKALYG